MKKNIAILGSTGSIGLNTLRIVETHPDRFRVVSLAAGRKADVLARQARKFRPKLVAIFDPARAGWLEKQLKPLGIRVVTGLDGLIEAAVMEKVQLAVFAVVGAVGLKPLFAAVRKGIDVAIANKEPLVMAGDLLMKEAARTKAAVLPIDSEHSALWQCMHGHASREIKKLILTSSGGPFRTRKGSLAGVSPREALKHPNWKMGPKITIDSATLMNKGLEVIEAVRLFDVETSRVDVMIHPESIIHSMIELVDGSHLAHMGIADMRLPIQYAMSYPERLDNHLPALNLVRMKKLTFEKPDIRRFPCLGLGFEAARTGGTSPAVLNAANEMAVQAFLDGRIRFSMIPRVIEKVLSRHKVVRSPGLEAILDSDEQARELAVEILGTAGKRRVKERV